VSPTVYQENSLLSGTYVVVSDGGEGFMKKLNQVLAMIVLLCVVMILLVEVDRVKAERYVPGVYVYTEQDYEEMAHQELIAAHKLLKSDLTQAVRLLLVNAIERSEAERERQQKSLSQMRILLDKLDCKNEVSDAE
jgi:hypothetical protein